ncbi:MAG: ribonuclease HII [Nitrospirae bacterium]|nr:ribonuclease HII [Nitrospirota bacterium]
MNALPPNFLYDEDIRRYFSVIAGIDEAGRGPLAGPVVAAAVILPAGLVIHGLDDSKKIPEKKRKRIFWEVVSRCTDVGVGIIDAGIIDRINILQATKLAMKTALEGLVLKPDILLIDAVKLSDINIRQENIIKGDAKSASIAAASVVAKVVRDDIMLDYHVEYPGYNFIAHKGYGTRDHIECLSLHGPCPIHRKSFAKVKV